MDNPAYTSGNDRSPRSVGLKGRAAEWAAILLLIILPAVVYLPVTIRYATFAGFDHTGINQPLKQEAFAALRSGHLPLWEHRLDRGLPLFAEGEPGIFYPLNLFFLIPGDFLTIYDAVLLLTLAIAGLLFYWWARRLGTGRLAGFIAGVAHQWGVTVNFNKANLNILQAFILAPLLMLLLEPDPRAGLDKPWRRAGWISLVFAAMLFAGQSQYVVYTALFALTYVVLRTIFSGRAWASTLFAMGLPIVFGVALGSTLAAVQLLPTLELIPLSERGSGALAEGFYTHGLWLTPERLFATFIFPSYHYSLDLFLPYLSTTIYVGPVAILLAGYAVRNRARISSPAMIPLLIAGIVFLYLAMGANAPLAGELTSWGPLAQFRGHGRLGGYFVAGMILLMGLGLDAILKAPFVQDCDLVGRRKCLPLFVVELILMALLTVPFITRRAEYLETRIALGLMLGFILIFFMGLLIGNLVRSRLPIVVAVAVVLAAQIIGFQATSSETILARSSWNPDRADLLYIRDESDSPDKAAMLAIRTQASVRIHDRILRRGLAAFEQGSHTHIDHLGSANAGIMENLTVCNADLPLELARWEWLVHRRLWPKIDFTCGPLESQDANLLWIVGANWVATENGGLEILGFERVESPDWRNGDVPYYIYRREYPLPSYWMYWQWSVHPADASEGETRDAFLDYLATSPVASEVFLEGSAESLGIPLEAEAGAGRRSAVSGGWRSPTEYVAGVNVSREAVYVFRDAWYPGWEVWVNGSRAELLRADLVYKAVRVPAGRSEVVFRYKSRYLLAGWLVSGVNALIIIALLAGLPRRTKAGEKATAMVD